MALTQKDLETITSLISDSSQKREQSVQEYQKAMTDMFLKVMEENRKSSFGTKAKAWVANNWQGFLLGVIAAVAYFSFFPGVGK